ncbi:MAG: twin-arginine translocase subunit TatC [Candidatus Dormibacteraceae bacterium]
MALLERVLQRGPGRAASGDGGEDRMTILEHLEALRRTLIISFIAWGLACVVGFLIWGRVLQFLLHRAGVATVYYHTPTGAFTLALKIAIYLGFVIASPIIIQQIWWFVSPGLKQGERRLVLPLIVATMFFFGVGIVFALFALPLFIHILTGFAPANLRYLPFVEDYINFILVLIIGFGIVFELPVVVYVLGLMGIISSRWLYANRFYWVIGIAILAYLATPGVDPVTPLVMFVPLYVFWEGTALLLRLTGH